MAEIFDGYMKQRLVEVALGRRKLKSISMATLPLDTVTSQGNGKYTVQSQSTPSLQYEVDLTTGFCKCTVGENGSLCKHQATCADYSMTALPQVFTATTENRWWLAAVAVGEENAPPESFFRRLVEDGSAPPVCESHTQEISEDQPAQSAHVCQDENPHQSQVIVHGLLHLFI